MNGRRTDETLVLYSRLAFYPVHWLALEEIAARYCVRAVALAAPAPALPRVHEAHGMVDPTSGSGPPIEVRRMPAGSRRARLVWLARQLRKIGPEAIWVQEEPFDPFLLEILALYRFRRSPRIGVAVCENVFPRPPLPVHLVREALWPRIDVLMAVATRSLEGVRAGGMPESVPGLALVAGALEPPAHVESLPLRLERRPGDFVVGFAGNLTEQKGWKVLVEAVRRLPAEFKLALAGDGEQRADLEEALASAELAGRVAYAGLLPKERLWGFYENLDCLVMPSITLPWPVEQFGGVLADGMAMGLPLIGSTCGAIPEVIGPAGLVVPEGDAEALAGAIRRLRDDPALGARLGAAGRARFRSEFAIPAYADKIAAALGLRPRAATVEG